MDGNLESLEALPIYYYFFIARNFFVNRLYIGDSVLVHLFVYMNNILYTYNKLIAII